MPTLTTPIILNQKGDVKLFESIREAEAHMEPVDLENAEFTVYDGRGFLLIPRIERDRVPPVRLDPECVAKELPQELVAVLQDFLAALRRDDEELVDRSEEEIQQMDLSQLISLMRSARERGKRRRGWWRIWRKRSKKG